MRAPTDRSGRSDTIVNVRLFPSIQKRVVEIVVGKGVLVPVAEREALRETRVVDGVAVAVLVDDIDKDCEGLSDRDEDKEAGIIEGDAEFGTAAVGVVDRDVLGVEERVTDAVRVLLRDEVAVKVLVVDSDIDGDALADEDAVAVVDGVRERDRLVDDVRERVGELVGIGVAVFVVDSDTDALADDEADDDADDDREAEICEPSEAL